MEIDIDRILVNTVCRLIEKLHMIAPQLDSMSLLALFIYLFNVFYQRLFLQMFDSNLVRILKFYLQIAELTEVLQVQKKAEEESKAELQCCRDRNDEMSNAIENLNKQIQVCCGIFYAYLTIYYLTLLIISIGPSIQMI